MATDYEKLGAFYLGREVEPATGAEQPEPLLYDSRHLTTHAVCLGMTGSGKTGLCLALLEEAAIDGVPALCIDPKGDLGNLALAFPALGAADFAPWMDPGEAARKSLKPDELAAQTATRWREGLALWDQDPARIARLRDAAEIAIYTPGSDAGLPLSVLRSFDAPPPELRADDAALGERASGVASGLLTLLGRDADPLTGREHILIARILDAAWRQGESPDLARLVADVQRPPFDRLGAMDLETFFPARDRKGLAMALNALLASPAFGAWTRGAPIDVQRLLYTPEGRPRVAIVSIAHLTDEERLFVVTLLLHELIAWMRRQPGTSSLRALLYMDEVFGFLPPTANPPSKAPLLTLLKQARASGLGCVLATQNPVDLDYKALGNAGTWFIGRLQTERDRERVLDGLTSALSSAAVDRGELADLLGRLTPRMFVMRSPQDEAPLLMRSRWALSFLRGPMTGPEIARVMAPLKAAAPMAPAAPPPGSPASPPATGTPPEAAAAATSAATGGPPALPPEIDVRYLPPRAGAGPLHYRPRVAAHVRLHYVDARSGLDHWQERALMAPLTEDGGDAGWDEAGPLPVGFDALGSRPSPGASFAELPPAAMRAAAWPAFAKSLSGWLHRNARERILVCADAGLASLPGESEGDFRARLAMALRERRDEGVAALRAKYATKLEALREKIRRATERTARERAQLGDQKLQTAISVGTTVLGALFGRKALSASTLGRATTAARGAGRIGRESRDVAQADESLQELERRLAALEAEAAEALRGLEARLDPVSAPLDEREVVPRKADIEVARTVLLWTPWRRSAEGFLDAAW